jgi:hypothetical protein
MTRLRACWVVEGSPGVRGDAQDAQVAIADLQSEQGRRGAAASPRSRPLLKVVDRPLGMGFGIGLVALVLCAGWFLVAHVPPRRCWDVVGELS